jgi:hypothetical protein
VSGDKSLLFAIGSTPVFLIIVVTALTFAKNSVITAGAMPRASTPLFLRDGAGAMTVCAS